MCVVLRLDRFVLFCFGVCFVLFCWCLFCFVGVCFVLFCFGVCFVLLWCCFVLVFVSTSLLLALDIIFIEFLHCILQPVELPI